MTSMYDRVLKGLFSFSVFVFACSVLLLSYALVSSPPPGVAHYKVTDIHSENLTRSVESHECRLDENTVVNCSTLPNANDIIDEDNGGDD